METDNVQRIKTSLYKQRCGFSMQFSFQYFFHFMDDLFPWNCTIDLKLILLVFAIDFAIFTMWLPRARGYSTELPSVSAFSYSGCSRDLTTTWARMKKLPFIESKGSFLVFFWYSGWKPSIFYLNCV